MDQATFASRYDAIISGPRNQRLYGASGYFNTGYWTDRETNVVEACDRLVDEIVASVPDDVAVVIDAGCGLGAGTRRVADRFPQALVIGANLSLWQLTEVQRRGVKAPLAMDAARMAIGSGRADAVLAMESPHHFDTRSAFFAEAYRVLRPGGVLAIADMLFKDADVIGPWMVPLANRIRTTAEYTDALTGAGFEDVVVRDVTGLTWRPFCTAMRAVFGDRQDAVRAFEESLSQYIFAFARRASDHDQSTSIETS